nr:S26 family signal peptidase [uncultured Desulfobacter sp.]
MKYKILLPCSLLFAVCFFVSQYCYINVSSSLPRGLYLKTSRAIAKGSYVVFHPTDSQQALVSKYVKNTPLMKRVAALPGQAYRLPPASHTDSKGRAITPFFPKTGIVPSAQFVVIGDTKYSLDSRYLGFVPQSSIVDTITPLFVF